VVFNLVCGGGDFGFLHEFFQEGDGEVGDTDGLCLSGGEELFHFLPGLDVGPGCVEVAGAVGVFGEFGVVAFGVHGDRPMHEVADIILDLCDVASRGLSNHLQIYVVEA